MAETPASQNETAKPVPPDQEWATLAASLAAEKAAHGETRARLVYRESARGWLRFPFAAARQRMVERR